MVCMNLFGKFAAFLRSLKTKQLRRKLLQLQDAVTNNNVLLPPTTQHNRAKHLRIAIEAERN